MKLLGVDNIFFEVKNLQQAKIFYEKLGFQQKFAIPKINAILISIGNEEPGLIISEKENPVPSKIWIKVEDADNFKNHCASFGVAGKILQTATGVTFEVIDQSGNTIGFADYSKKHELTRGHFQHVVEDYCERIWNKKDLTAIDDYLDSSIVIHSVLGDFQGQNAMKKIVETWLQAFSDLHVNNTMSISEKDHVVIHWHARGTHKGEFQGKAPTEKSVSYSGVTTYRLKNNKIVEYWANLDMQHLLNQL